MIHTNELMLGDLVKLANTNYIFNVEEIFFNAIRIKTSSGDYEDLTLEKFEPIELTNKMLLKNGVEYTEDCTYIFSGLNNKWLEIYSESKSRFSICGNGSISFKYVHELQHLLRMSGLTILADNFKIE